MSSSSSEATLSAPTTRDASWTNWAGNITSTPAYSVEPRNEDEVVEAVRFAIAQNLPVRVVGTGHSWTGLGATDGVQINVSKLSGLRVVDRERKRVAVAAGTSIFDACEALWEEGFSLKNQGDIDVQTIAGAASTGTHGSGITLANIASSIKRIRLVNGLGELVEITEDEPELLRAARISLGTLGVFVEIELEVTDRYYLEEEVTFPSWDELLEKWDSNVQENLHSSFFWFPTPESPSLYDLEIPEGVTVTDHAHLRRINKVEGPARVVDDSRRVDRNYLIYHGTFTGPYFEFEYFIPADRALEVMTRLREIVTNENPEELYPIQPRWIKGDDAYLSPCYKQDSVGISISGNASTDYLAYLQKMDGVFQAYGGRPHWGKFHFFNRAKAQEVFPEFDKFNSIRREFDPNDIFLNELTGELFRD
ncbi:D-arabinono-1,4-lactone oxidase [Paenarthrobacter sp. NPDC092416]|uniref:D-arabinono-1,4-lactone oxidase n=1 Tax=Paenarthrobacter sp. NPDC092416 TaxID=3364386 RepID=UPI0038067BC5